ncbi:hypothetical protein [Micromonospora sp. RTGN7]|uniref:hypothetical protein n=1 Tax=Micromonospora sp. RTGN7 TaxID=3016526 RepID=UPI0029FEEB77|nr:hypothetical protein [Micromonospora sp. RTGN7]
MHLIAYLHIALTTRLAELRRDGERGDSPVPTAVIIFGLVFIAMAVTGIALARANNWMNAIPNNTNPQAPAGP